MDEGNNKMPSKILIKYPEDIEKKKIGSSVFFRYLILLGNQHMWLLYRVNNADRR